MKITRQIDLVLHFLAYEWCNLTNFSIKIAIESIIQVGIPDR